MTTQYNLQQVVETTMVSVMAVSIMSVAMGIAIAAMGPELLTMPPDERKGSKKALDDLRVSFGVELVNKAIRNVGSDDILALCKEIEKLYIEDMKEKYGEYATTSALRASPPGDLKTAIEIAKAMSARGYGKFSQQVAPTHVEAQVVTVGTKKGRQKAKPQRDTTTGIVYRSKAAAGMAVAAEYGLNPTETFIWYEVIKKAPDRFVGASPAEYEAYMKKVGG